MNIVQPGNKLTLYGQKTPRVSIYKHESHKLHQAFNVKEGATIVQGMPVALTKEGDGNLPVIEPYTGTGVYLGIAVTDSVTPAYAGQRAYPMEVTVAVEGFAICHYAAAAAIVPGWVKPNLTSGAVTVMDNRYTAVEQSESSGSPVESKFIALAPASAPASGAYELVPVLVR